MSGGIWSSDHHCVRPDRRSWILAAFALGSILSTAPAIAQQSPLPGGEPGANLCSIHAVGSPTEGVQDLFAGCRGHALMLGPATSFEVLDNTATGATLVDLHHGNERRVLLVTVQDKGPALVEDLTGQIAMAAGRGPLSAIDGIELDLSEFPTSGDIGVQVSPVERSISSQRRIALGEQIAFERARRAGAASGN